MEIKVLIKYAWGARKSNQTVLAPLPENEAPARALFSLI